MSLVNCHRNSVFLIALMCLSLASCNKNDNCEKTSEPAKMTGVIYYSWSDPMQASGGYFYQSDSIENDRQAFEKASLEGGIYDVTIADPPPNEIWKYFEDASQNDKMFVNLFGTWVGTSGKLEQHCIGMPSVNKYIKIKEAHAIQKLEKVR